MTQIFKSYADFLLREDKDINGVDQEFATIPQYFESNDEALADMKRCAELEKV